MLPGRAPAASAGARKSTTTSRHGGDEEVRRRPAPCPFARARTASPLATHAPPPRLPASPHATHAPPRTHRRHARTKGRHGKVHEAMHAKGHTDFRITQSNHTHAKKHVT